MKKRIFLYGLIGAPIGVTINRIISVSISPAHNDGNFYPVVPELIGQCGSEINAVLLQLICSLICGAGFGCASAVWYSEKMSLLRMTVTHLIICCASMFPIAYFMRWMPRSVGGVLGYFGIFVGIYVIIWISRYLSIKRKIGQINDKVRGQNKNPYQ